MAKTERVEPAIEDAGGTRPEVVASTLEALQARVEQEDREALRGALDFHGAPGAGAPRPGDAP